MDSSIIEMVNETKDNLNNILSELKSYTDFIEMSIKEIDKVSRWSEYKDFEDWYEDNAPQTKHIEVFE